MIVSTTVASAATTATAAAAPVYCAPARPEAAS